MRKFRHKPSGEIFTQKNDLEMIGLKDSESDGFTLPTWLLEQGNDWEELVEYPIHTEEGIKKIPNLNVKEEPNYLITAFRSTKDKSLAKINSTGLYDFGIPLKDFLTGDHSVEDGRWEIYSVKNYKGEFALGEKVNTAKDKFTISKFEICGDGIIVKFHETWEHDGLELISKIKSPIYTTTDGVEVMKGDNIRLFLLNSDLNKETTTDVYVSRFTELDADVASRFLTFTSEESRDKYIKENSKKPVFVSADGVELFEGDKYYPVNIGKNEYYTWKTYECENEGLSEKTTIYKHIAYFSTEEARQEYIDNNKPKYSLADVEIAYKKLMYHDFPDSKSIVSELKKLGK